MKTHRYFRIAAFALITALTGADGASAQEHKGHEGHTAPATAEASPKQSEATKAYEEAMQKMHKEMTMTYTGDVDLDFVRGMIPHHQGAIDQAQVLLKYSKNPRLRRLAGGIIAAQRREIRFMQAWLKEKASGAETDEMPDWLKSTPIPSAEETTSTTPKP